MMCWRGTAARSVAVAAILGAPAAAQEERRFALTPYLRLPNIEGDLRFDPPAGADGSPDVEVGPADWLENLELGLTLAGEARFGRFSAG